MFGNLKLTQKGLLIVAVPLLLQVLFLVLYGDLLTQSEFLTRKEHRDKNVIGRSNWISTLVLSYNLGTVAQATGCGEKLDSIINYSAQASRSNFKELEELLRADDRQSEIVRNAAQVNEDLIASLRAIWKQNENADIDKTRQICKTSIAPSLQKLFDLRHDLLEAESGRYKIGVDSVTSIRQKKRDFITIAVVFDILLAVSIFWIFSREITDRLGVLAKNNELFASRKELNECLPGNDEVAQLDRSFHTMAQQIREAEERKQEYIQMISHDMRTPLTAVQCSIELLAIPDFNLSPAGLLHVQRVEKSLERVLGMINEMLEMERLESGTVELHQEIIAVQDIVKAALESVEPLANESDIKILVLESPSVDVFVDLDKAVRVVTNLIANAIKFSPPQTVIKISWTEVNKQIVRIAIQDQGRGIPAHLLNSVFDRFKQVDASDAKDHKGSGLGLAICKAIIEAHNGKIGVESSLGIGSTFWFELPIEEQD
jgi:signal transduction histidine kinase